MAILELKNVHKSYKMGKHTTEVLHGIDLKFNKGEFVSILGESGCGKSTLMNLIGGLDSNFEGNIIVDGKDIKKFSERELDDYRKDKVGFIFQSFNLIPHLTAVENVELAMTMSDARQRERHEKAIQLLTELGLENHLNKKPNQMSGGQKQRVAIARALANDPDIILADEPTGSIDSRTAEQILEILQGISNKGKLIIAVTHSNRVAEFGNRIISMADGNIVGDNCIRKSKEVKEKAKDIKLRPLKFFEAIKLAFNNMRLNIGRNILVSLGTSVGIFSIILMLSLGSGVENYIKDQIESSIQPLSIDVSKKSQDEVGAGHNITSSERGFEQEDIDYLKEIKGVDSLTYSASYTMQVAIVYNEKASTPIFFSTMDDTITKKNVIYGQLPSKGVTISQTFAENLQKKDIKGLIGKEVMVQIPSRKDDGTMSYINKKLLIDGIYNKDTLGYKNTTGVYIDYDTLAKIYSDNGATLKPTAVMLKAKDEKSANNIKKDLEKNGFKGNRQEDLIKQVTDYLNIAILILTCIAGISLIVSGIMILVVLYISVVERTREIGILRAIGARKKDIRNIFFVESAMLGLMGGIFGITIAYIISVIGNRIMINLFDAPFINLTIIYALFGLTVSTGVSIVAGLLPSNKAAKADPVESLRHE